MATTELSGSTREPALGTTIEGLSSELLALIFTQLRDLDIHSLNAVRCVSQRFHALATPLRYEMMTIHARITADDAPARCPRALRNIVEHTTHVVLSSDLDSRRVQALLLQIRKLKSVRLVYVDDTFSDGPRWIPSSLLRSHPRFPHLQLEIENLALRSFDPGQNKYLKAIPTDLLVSLKMGSPTPPLTTRLNSLKELLLQCRRLETFYYQDRGQGTQFSFKQGERLPPFRELSLRSYDWSHSHEEAIRHWDMSRLRSLSLLSVPIAKFLMSMEPHWLANLEHLHAEDFSAHLPFATLKESHNRQATWALSCLVGQHIRALRSLHLTCHVMDLCCAPQLDGLGGLLGPHAGSLEVLRLRDHVGFSDEHTPCPTIPLVQLRALAARRFRRLHTLEVDMDLAVLGTPDDFLQCITQGFPALHTLALNTQTLVRPRDEEDMDNGDHDEENDRDRAAAAYFFRTLLNMKARDATAWRTITVNVGGWQPVMVRRLSEGWRRLNARGVRAERCFVLKRTRTPGVGQGFRIEVHEQD